MGIKVWKVTGESMIPVYPPGSFLVCWQSSNKYQPKIGHRVVFKHPIHGVLVKTIEDIVNNQWFRSKGENAKSLSSQQIGLIPNSQILARVVLAIKA